MNLQDVTDNMQLLHDMGICSHKLSHELVNETTRGNKVTYIAIIVLFHAQHEQSLN